MRARRGKKRDRLLEGDAGEEFFSLVAEQGAYQGRYRDSSAWRWTAAAEPKPFVKAEADLIVGKVQRL